MELVDGVGIDEDVLARFCVRHGMRRLALFGSMARGEQHALSDVDLLVEFEPGRVPGLLGLAGIELELEELLGRRVDLRTLNDLSPHFRASVAGEAKPLYDAA